MTIRLKRAYDSPEPADGARFLVDRVWPRGVKKADLALRDWVKEAAPSTELRRWFGHDPERWEEFRASYFAELDEKPEAWWPIADAAVEGPVTLVFSARDTEHNNAVALKEFLEEKEGAATGSEDAT